MTPEQAEALKVHLDKIAKILYAEAESSQPEALNSLEGIEQTVRARLLKHVAPQLGVFLSEGAAVQQEDDRDGSTVV